MESLGSCTNKHCELGRLRNARDQVDQDEVQSEYVTADKVERGDEKLQVERLE